MTSETLMKGVAIDRVVQGDCLDVLRAWPAEVFHLAYLDPPFNTGKAQQARGGAFADRWPTMEAYLEFMQLRVRETLRVLKPNGVILLHCDWRTCHHFRLMLDEMLGAERFVNHLIWQYGLGGSSPRRFARKHDDILFYAKGEDYYFDPPQVPATSRRMQGQSKKATDVLDIPSLNNMSAERTGYPTQKPLALLEVLVRACSPEDGAVLDPFCGSGTTLVAAQRAGRRFAGVDASAEAVAITTARIPAD